MRFPNFPFLGNENAVPGLSTKIHGLTGLLLTTSLAPCHKTASSKTRFIKTSIIKVFDSAMWSAKKAMLFVEY